LTHLYRKMGGPSLPKSMNAHDYFPLVFRANQGREDCSRFIADDLPPEAIRDREAWRHLGIKSALSFPLSAGGGPIIGALSFDSARKERTWPEALVKRLQLIVPSIHQCADSEALGRKSGRSIEIEPWLANLSERFVSLPPNRVNMEIENAKALFASA